MKKIFLMFAFINLIIGCNRVKEKAKETINKSGEIVSKSGSEFIDGVAKGVEKTFENKVEISDELKAMGLKSGKTIINSSENGTDNLLTVYLIFDNNFDKSLIIKIFDTNNQEYGRVSEKIIGKKGEAKYFDFEFDKRTNIDGKGKIRIE